MAPHRDNPDEFEDLNAPPNPREAGEFTRAFGGRADKPQPDSPSSLDSSSSQPGSLTQALGGSVKPPRATPEKPPQAARPLANPSASPTADSFTSAFDGVNAFTRDLGDLREDPFKTEAAEKPPCDEPSSSGTFTRIFGAGEGVLTPAGPGGDSFSKPSPLPKAPMVKETNFSSAPSLASRESASFTEAFRSQGPAHPVDTSRNEGSFTEQFGAPSSWRAPEPIAPSAPPRAYPPASADPFRARQDEPPPVASPQRPATPDGGFTRLVGSYDSGATRISDATQPSIPVPRVPQRPFSDPNFAPPGADSPPDATIAFNPRRSETEFTAPGGKSEYTMVVERSKLRTPVEVPEGGGSASGGSPYGTGASASPPAAPQFAQPSPPQYPQMAPPVAPAWQPPAAPAPPWQPPPLAAPAMPQAPALAPPAPPLAPPTQGDKLIPFLPLILTLTVVNFLGMLAVLIILFATRK